LNFWGEIYVWTNRGRPVIVGSIFRGYIEQTQHRIFHEFHSLSLQPLFAGDGGAVRWQPEEPGIKFQPVRDAGEPDKNEAVRLKQMCEMPAASVLA